MYNEFNEQINKSAYYEQQGKGELDIKRYQRLPRQRGQGKIWSLAQRYAFPAGRFLLSRAMPIMKDLLSDLKPGVEIAKSNIKKRVRQKFNKFAENMTQQSGSGKQRKKRVTVMSGRGRKKGIKRVQKKKKQSGGKKRTTRKSAKRNRVGANSNIIDIFK